MEYPNNFDVPSFPAGKTVAFSRSMAIWISIVFFLIVVACGFVLFGIHQKKNYPFLISIDPFTDEWSVVAYPQEKKEIGSVFPATRLQMNQDGTNAPLKNVNIRNNLIHII